MKALFPKRRLVLLFTLFFIISVSIAYAAYWDYLTIGQADNRYSKIDPTTYHPFAINTTTGTLDMGNLTSVLVADDGNSYNVSEVGGANPMTIIINFSGVSSFSSIVMREWYEAGAGHKIKMGLEECDDPGVYEEEYPPDITDMDTFAFSLYNVLDPSGHICDGKVSLRLRHVNNGNPAHNFYLDYIVLQSGASTVVSEEVDPLSLHKSGDVIPTGNFNWGNFNISNLGLINISNIKLGTKLISSWDEINLSGGAAVSDVWINETGDNMTGNLTMQSGYAYRWSNGASITVEDDGNMTFR